MIETPFSEPDFDEFEIGSSDGKFEFAEQLLTQFAAEEEMLGYAEVLPFVRPALLAEFVEYVEEHDRRREQIRRMPMTLTLMVLAFFAVLGPGRATTTSVATNISNIRGNLDFLTSSEFQPEFMQTAGRSTNSWAIVEAYQSERAQRSESLRSHLADFSLR